MKKIIILVITIVSLIGILALVGAINTNDSQPSEISGPATLSSEENSFDFGTISMEAGLVRHSFAVKNTSQEEVIIDKIYTSCMCTEAILRIDGEDYGPFGMPGHGISKVNKKLGVGEEAVVEVVFDPAAHGPAGVGFIERAVYLENDSGAPFVLVIKATVSP